MGAKIRSSRRRINQVSYYLHFDRLDSPGSGFSFPCDSKGKVDISKLQRAGFENYRMCMVDDGMRFTKGYVVKNEHSYMEPAEAECRCGSTVVLDDPLDNVCDRCGTCYNMSGQEVVPSWKCDEFGNPYED